MMRFFFLILFGLVSGFLLAEDILKFDDPERAKRFSQLQHEIRCPKCQNQSIADSAAGISEDLRNIIHEKISTGNTDEEIRQFLKERYGDFILYKPEVKGTNLIIWFGPGLVFIAVVSFLFFKFRQGSTPRDVEPLSEIEHSELEALLEQKSDNPEKDHKQTKQMQNKDSEVKS